MAKRVKTDEPEVGTIAYQIKVMQDKQAQSLKDKGFEIVTKKDANGNTVSVYVPVKPE